MRRVFLQIWFLAAAMTKEMGKLHFSHPSEEGKFGDDMVQCFKLKDGSVVFFFICIFCDQNSISFRIRLKIQPWAAISERPSVPAEKNEAPVWLISSTGPLLDQHNFRNFPDQESHSLANSSPLCPPVPICN